MSTVILILLGLWLFTGVILGLITRHFWKKLKISRKKVWALERQLANLQDKTEVEGATDVEALRELMGHSSRVSGSREGS